MTSRLFVFLDVGLEHISSNMVLLSRRVRVVCGALTCAVLLRCGSVLRLILVRSDAEDKVAQQYKTGVRSYKSTTRAKEKGEAPGRHQEQRAR